MSITLWKRILSLSGIADGRLFPAVLKRVRLGGGEVGRVFKATAHAAGPTEAEATRISGHITRVGAARDMVRRGVESPAVMQARRLALC